MNIQDFDSLPATKGDIERILAVLETLKPVPATPPSPELKTDNPVFTKLEKRLAVIEQLSRDAFGAGLTDIPIDAETAALITGLARRTILNRGAHQRIDTIKIGGKLQFSLRGCIQLVNDSKRKAVMSEAGIAAYNHSKEVLKRIKRQVIL
jgi:hypothetical protein